MRKERKTTSFANERRSNRGFTLVELIVVLTILAILAAIGVASAVGYINKSKFDRNSEHAIAVYQAAQAALAQKDASGAIDQWVQGLKASDGSILASNLDTSLLTATNESVNATVHLTFNPGASNSESQAIRDFLSSYFYDQSIFSGTITIELDISATYGVDRPHYSARVLTVFYSAENTATEGWDEVCRGVNANGYGPTEDMLPVRDANYRYTKSHVGYFNGSESSVKPQISSVFLPMSEVYELDGHIVGPTEDSTLSADGYLFNMRNGETLDVSWAIFDWDGNRNNSTCEYDENFSITLYNAAAGIDSQTKVPNGRYVVINITAADLTSVRYNSMAGTPEIIHERIGSNQMTRSSLYGTVQLSGTIYDGRNTTTFTNYTFPITVTKVENDWRTGCPTDPLSPDGEGRAYYYEYSLTLDSMMTRSYDGVDAADKYNIERLFGNTPINISAYIEGNGVDDQGERNYEGASYYDKESHLQTLTIPRTFAARAINDPIYLTDIRRESSNDSYLTYCYVVDSNTEKNANDEATDTTGEVEITGRCVVNTLFGDLKSRDNTSSDPTSVLDGTVWTTSGGEAVLTSCRHLYNIRCISGNNVIYRIARDLDWYTSESGLVASEVRVYHDRSFKSPIDGGNVVVVSFPALKQLKTGQTLTSVSEAGRSIYAINNLQMRAESFVDGADKGYGLVCENLGTIYNIYTNNLNLVLASVTDGTDDRTSISPNGNVTIGNQGAMELVSTSYNRVGGLVGFNNGGSVGLQNCDNASRNIVSMRNCIVMGGQYWNGAEYTVGGVIGRNEKVGNNRTATTFGTIEVRGSFAIVSGKEKTAGGIIGDNATGIGARLVVDGTPVDGVAPAYTLPVASVTGQRMTCVVSGGGHVGGAIGWSEYSAFTYNAGAFSASDFNSTNMTFADRADSNYQIDVTLPTGSLLYKISSVNTRSVGGAIGTINECNGQNLIIRVRNDGYIISSDASDNTELKSNAGGAIGEDRNNTITTVYLDVVNGSSSRIGSVGNDYGPLCSGGAIGYTNRTKFGTATTIAVNVVNYGFVVARGNVLVNGTDLFFGAGGAIGGVNDKGNITFLISVANNAGKINGVGSNNGNATGGAIGGMGNMNSSGSSKITSSSVIFARNYGTITGKNYVGGVIGNASVNEGKIYAEDHGTIIATNDYVGGAIGRQNYTQAGEIQSILYNCTIQGVNFVGGAAGRIQSLKDITTATVRTIVKGSANVIGTGSLIGGVCGDINVLGNGVIELKGDSSAPTLTVHGDSSSDGVGGVAGILRSTSINKVQVKTPNQSSDNSIIVKVDGRSFIGGVIGSIRSINTANIDINDPSSILNNGATSKDINVSINVTFRPESYVNGAGDCVGGAVGFIEANNNSFTGLITVSSVAGSPGAYGSRITGNSNVGGAVGRMHNTKLKVNSGAQATTGITVDFTLASFQIIGTNSNVGGAVGLLDDGNDEFKYHSYGNTGNTFVISAQIGASAVVSQNGTGVGGAIGRNQVYLGTVNATLSGTVSGKYYIGGAIGCNLSDVGSVTSDVGVGGNVIGISYNSSDRSGTDVGGAIGYNRAAVTTVTATVSGNVIGQVTNNKGGNYVGGAIGRCYYDGSGKVLGTVTATVQGVATICGLDGVGGAIGFAQQNITSVESVISGNSYISGRDCVGGAIGYVWAAKNKTGDNILNGNGEGKIDSIRATINADYALRGSTCIGGAVGKSGHKVNGEYRSPALVYVEAVINTAYLFHPLQTGCGPDADACIGGVIGQIVDGRVGDVVLSGTGGTVDTGTGISTANGVVAYPCPVVNASNTVLIAANGRSIGGIVGKIGMDGFANDPQKVCLSNIRVAQGGPQLCVVSMNASNRIGGWIGSGYGVHGGIGNRSGDYRNNEFHATVTYDVNNVRMVYSNGSQVGGFCGYSDAYATNNDPFNTGNINKETYSGTYAYVNVTLNNACICGSSEVGGAFGRIHYVNFRAGGITVNLTNHSYVGDSTGSVCYDAGGAVGYLYLENVANNKTYTFDVPINVNIDATSRVWGSRDPGSSSASYGVGGVIGRHHGNIGIHGTLRLTAANTTVAVVGSAYTNVGGVIGVFETGNMAYTGPEANYSYSNAAIQANGATACAGGFVGRINAGTIRYCNSSGNVRSYGSNASVGGFAGEITGGSILYCYSTSLVNSDHGVTGGFVGNMNGNCTVDSSYVGGHTYEGQYIIGDGNVSGGDGYVGGFAGRMSNKDSKITNSYSTASVLGNATEVGGFVGYAQFGSISSSYCTGHVIGGTTATAGPGAFAGFSAAGNMTLSDDKCLGPVNGDMDAVGSGSSTGITIVTLPENITGGGSVSTVVPFDTGVLNITNCYLRSVINGTHHGDWPLVNQGGIPIDNADIVIDSGDPDAPTSFSYEYMRQHDFKIDDCITVIIDRGTPNEQILVRDTDYTISYRNNRAVGEATVIIAAKAGSNYQGVISTTFTITPVEISPESVNVQIIGSMSYEYTGAPIVPANDIRVTFNGVELVYNVDYYFTYPDRKGKENNNIDIGQITATIHGMGNYCDPDPYENPITVDFEITVIDISDNNPNVQVDMTAAEGLVYTGEPLTPAPIVRYGGRTLIPYDPAHPENDYDYSVDYRNNTEAGTATVTITANPNGNYTGSRSLNFDIAKAPNRWEVEPGIEGWAYRSAPETLAIVGESQFGNMSYYFYSDYSSAVSGSDENRLTEAQVRNADVGTYYARFFVDARESDSYYAPIPAVRSFDITPASIISASVVTTDHTSVDPDTGIPEYQYTGSAIVPALNVTLNGQPLELGTDYQIASYSGDHTNPTTSPVTVTIEGIGNYTGTNATCQFTIFRVYTVTFMTSASGDPYATQSVRSGYHAVAPAEPGTDEHHRFGGWYLSGASEPYNFDTEVVTSDITLNARWIQVQIVTFVTGDPSVVVDNAIVDQGDVVPRPSDPSRAGYEFDNWYSDETCTTPFSFESQLYVDTDVFAKWKPIVTFDSMGGSAVPSYAVTNGTVPVPAQPTRGDDTFTGWYTDEGCTNEFDFATIVTEPMTLYAGWE